MIERSSLGREFHNDGAATANAQSPHVVLDFTDGIARSKVLEPLRLQHDVLINLLSSSNSLHTSKIDPLKIRKVLFVCNYVRYMYKQACADIHACKGSIYLYEMRVKGEVFPF